jgi:drug/metabolite transporter (DMT)-like permease
VLELRQQHGLRLSDGSAIEAAGGNEPLSRTEGGSSATDPLRRSGATAAQLGLIAVAAVWGLTFVMVQDAVAHISVMSFLAYRFLAAAAIVAVVCRRQLARLGASGVRAGVAMGGLLTLVYVLQTVGLQHTTAANSGFITGLFVVITPVLGALVLRQRPGRLVWTSTAASALGLALLAGVGSNWHPLGDGLTLACAVAVAAHILLTDATVQRHSVGALLAVQLGVVGAVSLLAAVALGDLEAPHDGSVWLALAVTAIGASAIGYGVQSYAQQHAPPARTALILASEPAFAGLFGVTLHDDRLTLLGWAGAALILAAIVAVELVPRLRRPAVLPEG